MKKLVLFLLMTALNIVCAQPNPPIIESPLKETKPAHTRNLIIFFDKTVIGADELIAYANRQGGRLLYKYNHFNAIAVRIPPQKDYTQLKSRFVKLNGVLQVNEDQLITLDQVNGE